MDGSNEDENVYFYQFEKEDRILFNVCGEYSTCCAYPVENHDFSPHCKRCLCIHNPPFSSFHADALAKVSEKVDLSTITCATFSLCGLSHNGLVLFLQTSTSLRNLQIVQDFLKFTENLAETICKSNIVELVIRSAIQKSSFDNLVSILTKKKDLTKFEFSVDELEIPDFKKLFVAISENKQLTNLCLDFDIKGIGTYPSIYSLVDNLKHLTHLKFRKIMLTRHKRLCPLFEKPQLKSIWCDEQSLDRMEGIHLDRNTTLESLVLWDKYNDKNDSKDIYNGSIVRGSLKKLQNRNVLMHARVKKIVCLFLHCWKDRKIDPLFLQLGKDVFLLIMKMVYSSKTHWEVWEPHRNKWKNK